ncbi:CLUMA_CG004830, isoform A [Clunio marinus]|uniref:CLUMA_CG004830, isoform A n=1 Tax=Clunio marinus TaxID=568069 RepID=A0A1J1HSU4_9DIPT|nr:CLUMA_CG004830, isoform A [Clunio marinus]
MQRRARIKAVANLSSTRRATNKNSGSKETESQINESEKERNCKTSNKDEEPFTKLPFKAENSEVDSNEAAINIIEKKVEAISTNEIAEERNECNTQNNQISCHQSSENAFETFKTPLHMPTESTGPVSQPVNKFRRFKLAPLLVPSRTLTKPQILDENNVEENNTETPKEKEVISGIKEHEKIGEFTTPSPAKSSVTINHNIHYPETPQSPFHHHPFAHSRIRTESLCSIKSMRDGTLANLQPRKNIRTEDQKIIDVKRESRERLSNKDLDKSQLRMFDMIYFNPQNNPMKARSPHKNDYKQKNLEIMKEESPAPPVVKEASQVIVPQLRLNANGEMVLDETSLVVENEQQKQNRILLASTNVVYDDDLSGSYGYYKRQQRTKEWSHEETVKFYRCLNTVGTDFSLMLNLFPNRSRRDLKLKFKREERSNPQLIDKALLKHNTFDLEELQRDLDKEEEERRKDLEAKSNSEVKAIVKRQILKKQEEKLKAQREQKSKIEKILNDGEFAINVVDKVQQEAKENFQMPSSVSVNQAKDKSSKRKYTIETISSNEVVKVIHNENSSTVFSISHINQHNLEIPLDCFESLNKKTKPSEDLFALKANETVDSENVESVEEITQQKSSQIYASDSQKSKETDEIPSFEETNTSDNTLVINQVIDQIPEDSILGSSAENDQITNDFVAVSEKKEAIPKCRKKKIKPTLLSRQRQSGIKIKHEEGNLLVDIHPTNSEQSTEVTIDGSLSESKDEISIENPQCSVSPKLESFDEEAFLNSLNLENLVLVEAQRGRENVYEVHEIDPVSGNICDEPINLPAKYVDLMISLLQQQEEAESIG